VTLFTRIPLNLCAVSAIALYAAGPITEITLPGKELFPESITSLSNGTLIVASSGQGNIWRIMPGKTTAEEWIKPGTAGLDLVLGVLADEKSNTLWVCSNNRDGKGKSPTSAKTFDLKTGAPKSSYTLPGGTTGLCNDIAVNSDGTVYVADTLLNSVLMLKKGAAALEVAAKDDKLAGADGLAFGNKTTLFVNSVTTGKLLRLDLAADGKAKTITDLTLSQPLGAPDGMRSISKGRLLLAENAGKMDVITVTGNNAAINTIKDGLESTPAVTSTKGMAWIVEGKLNYRNDAKLKGKDPSPFKMYAVPLPK
jgi:sugar lactone lactonase YvrE